MIEILAIDPPITDFRGPWNGVLPQQDQSTRLRMHTFISGSDIVDKGANSIPVVNSGIGVGSDAHGTYMLFNGSSYLSFSSSLLNVQSYDITMIVGDLVYPASAQFGPVLVDARPERTNGRYLTIGYNQSAPFRILPSYNGGNGTLSEAVPFEQFPIVIKTKVRLGSITNVVNGKTIQTWNIPSLGMADNATYRVGRNAFSSSFPTPFLNGKVYYLDFKEVV